MVRPRRVALKLGLEELHKRHSGIFAGTQRYAQEKGWETIIDEYAAETLPARATKAIPYDGVIARATKKLAERAARQGIPVVNVWFDSPVQKQLPAVLPDLHASGRLRAEHLLERGLRRFAALALANRGHKVEVNAFRDTVHAKGFPCVLANLANNLTHTYAVWSKSHRQIKAWMSKWKLPIGVFVCGDEVGRLVVQMCQRLGWRVPQDVAINTGFNEEIICEYPRPSLSSVEMGYERIGYEAARLLDQLMGERQRKKRQPTVEPKQILLPPTGLVIRESTDFHAIDDPLLAAALEYIAANCSRDIGPRDVARAVSTDLRTLYRRFRKILGRSIASEIRRLRIERAKRELTQSDRSLTVIARDVGFGQRMRMYDVFCREVGVSPSEYRRQRRFNSEL